MVAHVKDGDGVLEIKMTPWKHRFLQQLQLEGSKSKLDVHLGGSQVVEPRLLAAVRGLMATYQSEIDGLSMEQLGDWDRPLNKTNEVWTLTACHLFLDTAYV